MIQSKTIPAIYVGTYAKYNNGSINGAWLSLTDYKDSAEFYKACKELHNGEPNPEFMFQDSEGFPEKLYSESGGIDEIYEYLNFIDDQNENAVCAFLTLYDIQDLKHFKQSYEGDWESEIDFAYSFIESQYTLEGILSNYFDYEKYARYLFSEGFYFVDGYVFSDF